MQTLTLSALTQPPLIPSLSFSHTNPLTLLVSHPLTLTLSLTLHIIFTPDLSRTVLCIIMPESLLGFIQLPLIPGVYIKYRTLPHVTSFQEFVKPLLCFIHLPYSDVIYYFWSKGMYLA
jgi:hypothetical protein